MADSNPVNNPDDEPERYPTEAEIHELEKHKYKIVHLPHALERAPNVVGVENPTPEPDAEPYQGITPSLSYPKVIKGPRSSASPSNVQNSSRSSSSDGPSQSRGQSSGEVPSEAVSQSTGQSSKPTAREDPLSIHDLDQFFADTIKVDLGKPRKVKAPDDINLSPIETMNSPGLNAFTPAARRVMYAPNKRGNRPMFEKETPVPKYVPSPNYEFGQKTLQNLFQEDDASSSTNRRLQFQSTPSPQRSSGRNTPVPPSPMQSSPAMRRSRLPNFLDFTYAGPLTPSTPLSVHPTMIDYANETTDRCRRLSLFSQRPASDISSDNLTNFLDTTRGSCDMQITKGSLRSTISSVDMDFTRASLGRIIMSENFSIPQQNAQEQFPVPQPVSDENRNSTLQEVAASVPTVTADNTEKLLQFVDRISEQLDLPLVSLCLRPLLLESSSNATQKEIKRWIVKLQKNQSDTNKALLQNLSGLPIFEQYADFVPDADTYKVIKKILLARYANEPKYANYAQEKPWFTALYSALDKSNDAKNWQLLEFFAHATLAGHGEAYHFFHDIPQLAFKILNRLNMQSCRFWRQSVTSIVEYWMPPTFKVEGPQLSAEAWAEVELKWRSENWSQRYA